MQFSFFKGITQTHVESRKLDWRAFGQEYLSLLEIRERKDGELYSAAIYRGERMQRGDANVAGMSAVVVDFDNAVGKGNDSRCSDDPTLPEDHATNLDGLTYAWHSTYTNTKDWPRWRLIIPLDTPCTPREWQAVFDYVMQLLGRDSNIDMSCADLSRAYWGPSCPPGQEDAAFHGFVDGTPLCLRTIVENADTNVVPLQPEQPITTIPTASDKYEGRNDALKAQVAAMLAKGKGLDEMVKELVDYDSKIHNPPLFSDTREGMRLDPWSNALKFIANNIASINSRRLAQGQPVQGSAAPAPSKAWALHWYGDIGANLETHDFVEDVLTTNGLSVVYGDSNTGKTFFVLDMALHVAAGRKWREKDVERGMVIYIAAEGGKGIFNRITAWKQHHKITDRIPFATITDNIEMTNDSTDPQSLIDMIAQILESMGEPVALIIIDTLSRALAGGNENSSEDMGAVVMNADKIRQATGAHVCFVHHSGKDQARGARGHSLLRAATDTEIEISRIEGMPAQVKITKQRELEMVHLDPFSLITLPLGRNRRGKPVNSCVVVPAITVELNPPRSKPEQCLDVLRDLFAEHRANLESANRDPIEARVALTTWRDELKDLGLLGKNAKQSFYWIKNVLTEQSKIRISGVYVTVSEK